MVHKSNDRRIAIFSAGVTTVILTGTICCYLIPEAKEAGVWLLVLGEAAAAAWGWIEVLRRFSQPR